MAGAAEQWAKRVRRLERSGLSVRRFAARRVPPVEFIELQPEPEKPAMAQPFEVELRSGRRVRVGAGFDAAELARLVVVLEEARP